MELSGRFLREYEVQMSTVCDSWINCWQDTDENGIESPTTFDSYAEAEKELHEYIADTEQDFLNGNLSEAYDINDYRIVEIKEGVIER